MVHFSDLHEIAPAVWEIPAATRSDMRVPARIHINRALLESILADKSLEQLINVTTLPGIQSYALAMPDIHQGYGFPVGGVAAIRTSDGVISPGGIGYDINCGVRLLCSDFEFSEFKDQLKTFTHQLARSVPSGVGRGGPLKLGRDKMDDVLAQGSYWALEQGFASREDIESTEELGRFKQADPDCVSKEAKERGCDQLGTLGSGNHFLEVQKVSAIGDKSIAEQFGLFEGQVCVMVHTGSRGLGHQTCTDYVRLMNSVAGAFGIKLPDRELACAPYASEEGRRYLGAMAAAANFAWANRQLITHHIREAWFTVMGRTVKPLRLLYDVCHNIAKLEHYEGHECIVHRKGATRSFGPGEPQLPDKYRKTGQPVIIPGSMGTASYVLAGTADAMAQSFGSCCHGAGRALSRMRAKKSLDYQKLLQDLQGKGIVVSAGSAKGLLEEAPEAYKNVDEVVNVVEETGIARVVAKLVPIGVVKG